MISSSTLFTLLAALLAFVHYGEAIKGDQFVPESWDDLSGSQICLLKDKRISHISTIKRLAEAFESPDQIACRSDWHEPLIRLQAVLEASAGDACSLETIGKIEDFHWSYVVGTLSKSWRAASEGTLPEPLRLFFIHFARETIRQCQLSVSSRLKEAIAKSSIESTSLSGGSLGLMLRTISVAMVPQDKIKNFDDFFFIYEAIINSEKRKGNLIEETIPDPRTGEVTYMSIKLQDPTRTHEIQERCKKQLRPIYSSTVLPVMRLIDLGFGARGQRFHEDEKVLAEWYEIAQFCELLLPIKFLSTQGQVAEVKNEGDLAGTEGNAVTRRLTRPQITAVHLGDLISNADDDSVVEQVKSSFRSRARVYRKTLRNALSFISGQIASRFKRLFSSKKTNDANLADENEMKKSLAAAEKAVVREEQEERHEESATTTTEVAAPLAADQLGGEPKKVGPKKVGPLSMKQKLICGFGFFFVLIKAIVLYVLTIYEFI